jgi:crotonobetainyl-CoA:carnitine CoA-transferase CaiB-like acyl-CoA transferase
MGSTRPEYGHVVVPPAPGFGDSIGAMTIAGGVLGALYHRERTGDPTVVDVSLLGSGIWAMGQAIALSLAMNTPWRPPPTDAMPNPLVYNYLTSDAKHLALNCLQAGKYWAELCQVIGRPELADDPRFADHASLLEHRADAIAVLTEVFAQRPMTEWRSQLERFSGQWAVVQDSLEVVDDPQTVANGYIQDCKTASGTPFRLAAAPVQFDDHAAAPKRAPEFNEHGDAILADLGFDFDTIIDLKVRGVVA